MVARHHLTKLWNKWQKAISNRRLNAFGWLNSECERLASFLGRLALIKVLEYVGKLSLLGALISFLWGIPERRRAAEDTRKTKHYQAWQTINSALGQAGNGGRIDALQDLNKDRISLAGVDISGAFLMDLKLPNAYMQFARMTNVTFVRPSFRDSYLWHVVFRNSYFEDAIFDEAMLQEANFSGTRFRRGDFSDDFSRGFSASFSNADLSRASFRLASLEGVDFEMARLVDADFTQADLQGARLMGADLSRAAFWKARLIQTDLQSVNLDGVDFEKADLTEANFESVKGWGRIASLTNANIYNIRNPPMGFVEWATNKMGAISIPPEDEWF